MDPGRVSLKSISEGSVKGNRSSRRAYQRPGCICAVKVDDSSKVVVKCDVDV